MNAPSISRRHFLAANVGLAATVCATQRSANGIARFNSESPDDPESSEAQKAPDVPETLAIQTESRSIPRLADPVSVGMNPAELERIAAIVEGPIANGDFPGCVVAIGRGNQTVYRRAFGSRSLIPPLSLPEGNASSKPTERSPIEVDTLFDLASLTKPIATSTAVMRLVDQRKLDLDQTVASIVPEFAAGGKSEITLADCLLHQSGLIADNALSEYQDGIERAWERIFAAKLVAEPKTKMVYSDVNFIVLAEVVRRIVGRPFDQYVREEIFLPLGMTETGYLPNTWMEQAELERRAAPTQSRNQRFVNGKLVEETTDHWMCGEVHDPRAFALGGVAGHAGLFSTAVDLCTFAQMMLGHGTFTREETTLRGTTPGEPARGEPTLEESAGGEPAGTATKVSVVSAATWDRWVKPRYSGKPGVNGNLRGYGWDIRSDYSGNRGRSLSPRAFGHGGFTGTGLWIDPESELYVVFLANRVHPDGNGSCNRLIGDVGQVASDAIDWSIPPTPRVTLSPWSQVECTDTATEQTASNPLADPPSQRSMGSVVSAEPETKEKRSVLSGIDVLRRDRFDRLDGARVGLITNPTGMAKDGVRTTVLLHEASNVELVSLFSPEHGLYAMKDGVVTDETDSSTGLRVWSLYGETRRPTAAMLDGIDTLVFDIQDIGTRFYTYMATMGEAMIAASQAGLRFVVLDRPNPIGGVQIEGPITDAGRESFIAWDAIPLRHGMTMGELARFFQRSRNLESLKLEIVPCERWNRADRFDRTGQPWVSPSPNMRNLVQELLYPGIGLLETTNLSVGRGTATPFEWFGAPWLSEDDAAQLVESLQSREIPGIFFATCRFTPNASVHAKKECRGVQMTVTNPDALEPVRIGFEIAIELERRFADRWNGGIRGNGDSEKGQEGGAFDRLLVHRQTLERLSEGKSYEELAASWATDGDLFVQRRAEVLLYPPST